MPPSLLYPWSQAVDRVMVVSQMQPTSRCPIFDSGYILGQRREEPNTKNMFDKSARDALILSLKDTGK